jgi:Transposase and inactivated derivatives
MPQKLLIPNKNYGNPSDLLKWIDECKNIKQAKRFGAIRLLMLGKSREDVMEIYGVVWGTLQKWVKLWNKGGKELLMLGKPTGRPTKLTQEAKDFIVKQFEFTDKRTGEKITAISISGVLEKKIQDKIKARCDSLSSSQDGLQDDSPPDIAT